MAKPLKDILAGVKSSKTEVGSTGTVPGIDYKPKAGDEADFVAKHATEKHAYRDGNDEDIAGSKKMKQAVLKPSEEKHRAMKGTYEEVENIDELSKTTLGSYVKKASTQLYRRGFPKGKGIASDPIDEYKAGNRLLGVYKASNRLAKEETEDLEELSKTTLGSYVKKAVPDREALGQRLAHLKDPSQKNPRDRGHTQPEWASKLHAARTKGINRAVDKLTKEEVEDIDEMKINGHHISNYYASVGVRAGTDPGQKKYTVGLKRESGKWSSKHSKEFDDLESAKKYKSHLISKGAKDLAREEVELDETKLGFNKLKRSLSHQSGVRDPGALAASIGRKKYGKKRFQKAAAADHKLAEAHDAGCDCVDCHDKKTGKKLLLDKNKKIEEAAKPLTRNPGHGMHGELSVKHGKDKADDEYNKVHRNIRKMTGEKPTLVRHFLDSKYGRHLHGYHNDEHVVKKHMDHFKKKYNPRDFQKEEAELDEAWVVTYPDGTKSTHRGQVEAQKAKAGKPGSKISATHGEMGKKAASVLGDPRDRVMKLKYEHTELDEVSKDTLASYIPKAAHSIGLMTAKRVNKGVTHPDYEKNLAKQNRRHKGIQRAVDRLANEETIHEEDMDRKPGSEGVRVKVHAPKYPHHGKKGTITQSDRDGSFHVVDFGKGKTASYHGSDLRKIDEAAKLYTGKAPRKGTLAYNIAQQHRKQYLNDFAKDPHGKLKPGDKVGGPSGTSTVKEDTIDEVLTKKTPVSTWIHDFVHSDNPKFAGKSSKQRQRMAVAAYYAKQRNEDLAVPMLEDGKKKKKKVEREQTDTPMTFPNLSVDVNTGRNV